MIHSSLTKDTDASLADVNFQMAFGYQFGFCKPGSRLLRGETFGVKADYVLRTQTNLFSIDCKTKRHGASNSSWQTTLEEVVLQTDAVIQFRDYGSGVAIIRIKPPGFLKTDEGRVDLQADIKAALEGKQDGFKTLKSAKIHEAILTSREDADVIIRADLIKGETASTITNWAYRADEEPISIPGAVIVIVTSDLDRHFVELIQKDVRNVLERQALKDKPAIVAFNLDYLTRVNSRAGSEEQNAIYGFLDGVRIIRSAVLSCPDCSKIYGVLIWANRYLQSTEVWRVSIGTNLGFWANRTYPGTDLLPREFIPHLMIEERLEHLQALHDGTAVDQEVNNDS